jgi:hypothetical protein
MCKHVIRVRYLGPTDRLGARLTAREVGHLIDAERRHCRTVPRDYKLTPEAQGLAVAADVADRNCDRRPHAATFHFADDVAQFVQFVIVEGAH